MSQTGINDIHRYELKYTINEAIACEIKNYIQGICRLDEHVPEGEQGYIVNNLYFDSSDLQFYYDTKFRKLTRYKLRARFYGKSAKDFIFPEIKYRHSSIIWKKRKQIPIETWPSLFKITKKDDSPRIFEGLDSFEDMLYWHQAEPILHVRYYREPYVTDLENYGRITFDRQLRYCLASGSINLNHPDENMLYYDDPITTRSENSPVLLEIKTETRVPQWTIDLIHTFNLIQRPFSKYCYGIDNILDYPYNGRNAAT